MITIPIDECEHGKVGGGPSGRAGSRLHGDLERFMPADPACPGAGERCHDAETCNGYDYTFHKIFAPLQGNGDGFVGLIRCKKRTSVFDGSTLISVS